MPISRRPLRRSKSAQYAGRLAKRLRQPSLPDLTVDLTVRWTDGSSVNTKQVTLAGSPRRRTGRRPAGVWNVAEREAAARRLARGVRPEAAARLLAALAHGQRIDILLELLGGEATHRSLAKATGLKSGPLYHHLRELRMAGLIGPKVRDLYVLTAKGGRAILAVMAIERLCR